MKFASATLSTLAAAAIIEDNAVLLSTGSVRSSASAETGLGGLIAFAQEDRPRKASQLLQQFARNTLDRGEEVDDITKKKLKEIAAQLTNNTWMALEQGHRRDQDLINKHWRAIKICGDKHIAHLQQDVDGLEVQQVRTHELDMVMCRGLPNHTNPFASLLQTTQDPDRMCCRAMTPACLSCAEGVTEEEWCSRHPGEFGCPDQRMCCRAMTPACLSCAEGITEEEWCRRHPGEHGCPDDHGHRICCRAMTPQCLSCAAGMTEFEYCAQRPRPEVCGPDVVNGHINTQQHGIDYVPPDTELPEDYDTVAWLADTKFAMYKDDDGNYQRYFKYISKMYTDETFEGYFGQSLLEIKNEICEVCGELDAFLAGLPAAKPNCEPTFVAVEVDPQCTTDPKPLIETDLDQWFDNLVTFADYNLEKWKTLKAACDASRSKYADRDAHCDAEQEQYEQSFCAYRQGLHSTCAEYQGCHILNEEQFKALIQDVLYAADSRKIDWKAIHKIACYIKVLISDGTNQERTYALENCESGDLNTLATILTGFNESNYLSLIIPEISGNVSCWDLDVPPLIDFKECDMTSVHQYPCTEKWMDRYEGFESPGSCVQCAALPEHMQYSDKDYQQTTHYRLSDYGGGWIFVNELGRSTEDINDLSEIEPTGYFLPQYNMKGLRWNEVLIQRVSPNWCDSWGRQTSKWVEEDGASMCVQSDNDHVYCTSNHNGHTWRQQPTSHFAALCGKDGQPACDCWPFEEGLEHVCFAHDTASTSPHAAKNVLAPRHVTIHSLEEDGSVVKVSFRGEEKVGVLRVGNYGSFLDGVGCGAVTPVSYRVFVRCLGCTTERSDFHSKDGAQFVEPMTISQIGKTTRSEYTYEAWFKSPLEGKFRREIFGGATGGFMLVNEANAECQRWGDGTNEHTTYQLHAGNTNAYSTTCFQKNQFYHVAVTRDRDGVVKMFVNGHHVSSYDDLGTNSPSHLATSFGAGFVDGGQLFNVRIWDFARTASELVEFSAVTDPELMDVVAGLAHWWPLTGDIKDLMTGAPLTSSYGNVRYSPIWCSDLEGTGMRVC